MGWIHFSLPFHEDYDAFELPNFTTALRRQRASVPGGLLPLQDGHVPRQARRARLGPGVRGRRQPALRGRLKWKQTG